MIVVVGLSHRSQAPIEVRERLALSHEQGSALVDQLIQAGVVREAVLLSTCNRVELIAAGEPGGEMYDVAGACADLLLERCPDAAPFLYKYVGGTAVRHLLRVAASLDSMVLGEPQILGQLKQAFERAQQWGTVGRVLHRTVPHAIRAAKKVRTETSIGSGQVSVPTVAVDLARQIFGELAEKSVVLVGSGEMGRSVARLLRGEGARLLVVGRTPDKTRVLAEEVGGQPRAMSDLRSSLVEADVVVSSTSAPHYVVDAEMVAKVRRSRRGRSLFFIDLAVPRDIDPDVQNYDGMFLYNIDDFSRTVAETVESRRRERDAAERIIDAAAEGFERWADAAQVTPVIKALRSHFHSAFRGEIEKSLRGKLKGLDDEQRAAVEKMVDAAIKKSLHEPVSLLREAAAERAKDNDGFVDAAVDALVRLFSLDLEAVSKRNESVGSAQERSRDQDSLPLSVDRGQEDPSRPAVGDTNAR